MGYVRNIMLTKGWSAKNPDFGVKPNIFGRVGNFQKSHKYLAGGAYAIGAAAAAGIPLADHLANSGFYLNAVSYTPTSVITTIMIASALTLLAPKSGGTPPAGRTPPAAATNPKIYSNYLSNLFFTKGWLHGLDLAYTENDLFDAKKEIEIVEREKDAEKTRADDIDLELAYTENCLFDVRKETATAELERNIERRRADGLQVQLTAAETAKTSAETKRDAEKTRADNLQDQLNEASRLKGEAEKTAENAERDLKAAEANLQVMTEAGDKLQRELEEERAKPKAPSSLGSVPTGLTGDLLAGAMGVPGGAPPAPAVVPHPATPKATRSPFGIGVKPGTAVGASNNEDATVLFKLKVNVINKLPQTAAFVGTIKDILLRNKIINLLNEEKYGEAYDEIGKLPAGGGKDKAIEELFTLA